MTALALSLDELLDRRYRLNPAFRVVPFDRLADAERTRLAPTRHDPQFETVLMPCAPGLSAKAISADTATLLRAVELPATLPGLVRSDLRLDHTPLVRLLLDSVLEVEIDGRYISGLQAAEALELIAAGERETDRVRRLSINAMRYAQALECGDASVLSARLYFYNRAPMTPRWRRRIANRVDFAAFLGLQRGDETRRTVVRDWSPVQSPSNPGWLFWRSRRNPERGSPYKLYLSPRCEDLPAAFRIALPILSEFELPAFKLGRDVYGILRPDKFVIYAQTLDRLRAAAASLLEALAGVEAQAVPFTAPIDDAGLVSWGADPPRRHQLSRWQGTSWRRWITDQLAVSLLIANGSADNSPIEPWQFALARIGLEGVNTETWVPENVEWTVNL